MKFFHSSYKNLLWEEIPMFEREKIHEIEKFKKRNGKGKN